MKKLRIISILFILAFSFSVKAEVLLEVDCNSKEIVKDKTVTCEGYLVYEEVKINDIHILFKTNLDINFLPVNGFTIEENGNNVHIHTDTTLYDEIMNSTMIMKFTLSLNDKCNEKEELHLSNIKIDGSSDITIQDVSKVFSVTLPKEEIKLDDVNTLNSITVENEKIKDFNKDKNEYHDILVQNEIIFIDAVRTSDKSSASGLGNARVPKGETVEHDIVVLAEDGSKNIYKLFITNTTSKDEDKSEITPEPTVLETIKSNDNTLKSLELYHDKRKIDFDFDNTKDTFNIKIENEVINKITIKAILNDSKATFVSNYGPRDIKLVYGNNKILLKTKAQNNDIKTITINISYQDSRNQDNYLSMLKINDQIVNLENDKLEIKLPNSVDKTKIEAVAKSDKAVVKYEDVNLKFGDNNVQITVTAENGDVKEYQVNVIRENDHEIDLTMIEVKGYDLIFSKDKKEYVLEINNDTQKLDIIVTPNDIDYKIVGNENLGHGSKITIKVNNDEYIINITKNINNNKIFYYIGIGIIVLVVTIAIYYLKKRNNNKTYEIEEI